MYVVSPLIIGMKFSKLFIVVDGTVSGCCDTQKQSLYFTLQWNDSPLLAFIVTVSY